jgi:arylsulfatase A-like enzyme
MQPTLSLPLIVAVLCCALARAQDPPPPEPERAPPPVAPPAPTPVASDDALLPASASAAVRAAFEPLARAKAPLVVRITSEVTVRDGDGYKREEHAILGTLVAADGFILTKASDAAGRVRVTFSDGTTADGWVAVRDEEHDLALVRVERADLPVALFDVDASTPEELPAGRFVASIGAGGTLAGVGVIGTPARAIREHDRGYLGVHTEDVEGGGVKVTRVLDDAPAQDAGLQAGDVLRTLAGDEILDSDGLRAMLRKRQPGDTIQLGVTRGEEELDVAVELGAPATGDMRGGHVADQMAISERRRGFPSVHQHDADVQPGDCGGPVYDARERLVGFNVARMDRPGTLMIPSVVVVAQLELLLPRARAAEEPVPEALALDALAAAERAAAPAEPGAEPGQPAARAVSAGPHVLLFVIDDAPWTDFGRRLAPDLPHPTLDALSASGVRCVDAYAASSHGSPARAALLTGRYPQRSGHENEPSAPEHGLDPGQPTLAELLGAVGYTSGAFGKWDLGSAPALQPAARGFAEHCGFLAGPRPLGPLAAADATDATRLTRAGAPVEETGPLAARLAEEAAAFIAGHAGDEGPMFVYVAFQALQRPLPATSDFADLPAERRALAAATAAVDAAIGRVLQELEVQGLTEDSLVVVTGDNAVPEAAPSPHDPRAGAPGSVFQGSLRVPLLLRWPGQLPRGRPYPHPVSTLDVAATIVAAAGATPAAELPLDGVNLVPLLDGARAGPAHRALFWRSAGVQSARLGDWCLVDVDDEPGVHLYNLARDPQQSNDLSSALPDQRNALLAELEAWERGLVAPRWE